MSDKATVRLAVVEGPMKGKEFRFEEHDVFLLGRSPDCQCVLPDDPCVSRHHFLLEANPPDCSIRDLGSLNGTYVNGVRHGGRGADETPQEAAERTLTVAIKDGDSIHIGGTTLKVEVTTPLVCGKCGKVLAGAEAQAQAGEARLCAACKAKPRDKQAELLAGIIGAAAKRNQECPEIPGY